jgi:RNA polymerase sigma-54 factor
MALSQKLQMRQGQSLVMTPQLQQAIKLLQMSNFELQAFVESELEQNPLLERDERDDSGRDYAGDDAAADAGTNQPGPARCERYHRLTG